ncbi:MAG: gamma-glutamylcyclotransferase family protein [Actinomycetota bacterium]
MRMAFYGTLRPGESHHYEVRNIAGTWRSGSVRGWAYDITWGPADGYPGMTLDAGAPETPVDVLESDQLEKHLRRLDDFEGPGYRRVEVEVTLDDGSTVTAWLYEADPEA